MKKKTVMVFALAAVLAMTAAGCGSAGTSGSSSEAAGESTALAETGVKNTDDDVVQLSTLTALSSGDFTGSRTVGEMSRYGDFGLGTYDGINGEMIVLDGRFYQVLGTGEVVEPAKDETVPFMTICSFDKDDSIDLKNISSLEQLKEEISKEVEKLGINSMYAVKIHTKCDLAYVRSEDEQAKPYKKLAESLKGTQHEFKYDNIEGTLVCFYFPDYMKELNSAGTDGWHVHFISDDGTKGGHMFDVRFDSAAAEFDEAAGFRMLIPDTDSFQRGDINASQEDIDEAEKK